MVHKTQAEIEQLIEALRRLLEATHLQDRPISRLAILSDGFLEIIGLYGPQRFYQQILPRVIERFNEEGALGRLTPENEMEMLMDIIAHRGEVADQINLQRIRRDMPAMGIHNYSEASVIPERAAPSATCAPGPKKLNEAVLHNMRHRLEAKKLLTLVSYADSLLRIKTEIAKKYKSAKDRELADRAIQDGFSQNAIAQEELKLVFNFMLFFHPNRFSLWIDQFVGESITAYKGRNNPLSCTKGTTERLITGLRGIDSELDVLFAQAEGPATMQAILTTYNFGESDEKAGFVAKKLIELGYKSNTTPQEAAALFSKFLANQLAALKIKDTKKEKSFSEQIELYADLVEGDLERKRAS